MPFIKRTIAMAQLKRVDCASLTDRGRGKRSAEMRVCKRWMNVGHDGEEMYRLIWGMSLGRSGPHAI